LKKSHQPLFLIEIDQNLILSTKNNNIEIIVQDTNNLTEKCDMFYDKLITFTTKILALLEE